MTYASGCGPRRPPNPVPAPCAARLRGAKKKPRPLWGRGQLSRCARQLEHTHGGTLAPYVPAIKRAAWNSPFPVARSQRHLDPIHRTNSQMRIICIYGEFAREWSPCRKRPAQPE
ncbi:hypothetical protein PUN4_130178 [Paraburkholderia unamae]|nr:hypothetical protein PUN4_130178 [Paraburkholderia unamae]